MSFIIGIFMVILNYNFVDSVMGSHYKFIEEELLEYGYNFIEYVNLRKIELARQMLQDGKMVYEVSELLGFENSTYFSRVFKRYTDVSPDTYRKQM